MFVFLKRTGLFSFFLIAGILFSDSLPAQYNPGKYNPPLYLHATEQPERVKTAERIIQNVIYNNLKLPLDSTTEENWEGALNAMEVVNYHDEFTWAKMQEAMSSLPFHSTGFQRSVLEAAYAVYPGDFIAQARSLMKTTTNPKIFAMCAVYLMKSPMNYNAEILNQLQNTFGNEGRTQPVLSRLIYKILNPVTDFARSKEVIKTLLGKQFLPGRTVVFSIQRENRDYPGMVIIRKPDGSFVQAEDGIFHVAQLARGIANLPYFLTKGNTPQGIYRMFGFGVSKNQFIGPTANIQMGMPVELTKEKFFEGKPTGSSEWNKNDYAKLLPAVIRDFDPLFETYYAGLAGRNEIIAHGTTINPEYYKHKPYYPLTPTEGCLCAREEWNGKLIDSDQQRIVNALLDAGGANGFLVVMEIDNQEKAVTPDDLKGLLP